MQDMISGPGVLCGRCFKETGARNRIYEHTSLPIDTKTNTLVVVSTYCEEGHVKVQTIHMKNGVRTDVSYQPSSGARSTYAAIS